MPTTIGQYEIQSDLAKSATGAVYKANDSESGQTVALKAIQLSAFGDQAAALEKALQTELEAVKVLTSPNLTLASNPAVIDGQFCTTMEYVQGNSIATMLARGEGFSIWDLLDIGRQLCGGLAHASSHQIVHYSLEPSKIMCGWDGTVKILSFGVSSVGNFVQHASGEVSSVLYYMSPEQLRGEALDLRSNLFSLGAIFYEMVTEKKAFNGADAGAIRQSILESTPVPPVQLNAKVHPLLSDLIMKALAKDPAQRYQNGRSLLDDLEKCKENRPAVAKAPVAAKSPLSANVNAAAQAKFAAPAGAHPQAAKPTSGLGAVPSASSAPAKAAGAPVAQRPVTPVRPAISKPAQPGSKLAQPVSRLATPKSAAAAAGVGASSSVPASQSQDADDSILLDLDSPEETPSAHMSAAAAEEPQVQTFEPAPASGPKIAIDPLMAEGGPAHTGGTSFSEIDELPPLKEVYTAPPPPPPAEEEPPAPVVPAPPIKIGRTTTKKDEKPKIQPRQVASKAIKEVKNVPPKLMMYSLGTAAVLILAIAIGVMLYIHGQNSDEDAGASRPAVTSAKTASEQAPPQQPDVAPAPSTPQDVPSAQADAPAAEAAPTEVPEAAAPVAEEPARPSRSRAPRRRAAPVMASGQLTIDSNPQGAQVHIDGRTDLSWVTPLSLTNLQPGQHSVTVSKAGYSSDTRSVQVNAGGHASTTVRLSQLTAMLVVKSNPPGANIFVDSRDVGTKTPAQVSVSKGQHVVLVRMPGYLDETMSAQFVLGQTFNFSPTLRPLGDVDSVRTVGKMSRLFKRGGAADQGTISIHTTPKGAQVAINQRMIEKNTPVDLVVDPGNYEVDITLSGYAPVHKVVNAERGGKEVIEEVLQKQ